ncbi:hypothetical protein LEMLEM_LOCUS16730 [Lemmus lemmus]
MARHRRGGRKTCPRGHLEEELLPKEAMVIQYEAEARRSTGIQGQLEITAREPVSKRNKQTNQRIRFWKKWAIL